MEDFEAPVPMEETPEAADPMSALMALSRQQQARRDEALARLRALAQQHGAQAQGLRTMSLLTSMGQNPLLQGLQRESGQQGSQLQGMAMQAESRADATERGIDPLGIARLQQLAEYQKGQQGLAAQAQAQRKAEAEAKTQADKDKAAAGAAAAAKKAGQKGEADNIKMEGNLRKALEALPAYKNYQIVATTYDTMQHSFAQNTAAGDISGITTFMKSIDPATGVRDQEFNNAARSGGIVDRATVALERLRSGQLLTPQQRREFSNAAQQNTLALKKSYDQAVAHYRKLAADYKANPEHLATPIAPPVDADTGAQSSSPSSQRTPAHEAMPPGPGGSLLLGTPPAAQAPAGGDMVRVNINGVERPIPRAKLEAFRARAAERKDTFEVVDG